jgi:hypothetical protein
MATLDEITKEKQRISEALARVDMQREKLARQLGELEATERVLARYSKGTQAKKPASARTPITATKPAAPARRHGARPRRLQNPLAANTVRRTSATRSLRWQPARRSRKSPLHARALAPTMSAPRFPGTSGRAASKSAMGNSTPYRQRGRSNRPRSDTGIKSAGRRRK